MLKPSALIGHTGFVGANIFAQHHFDLSFNSKNFLEMREREFGLVVCSGISAVKWWANQNADQDWKNIERLLAVLDSITAERFVLISTVDVYPSPQGVDELTNLQDLENHPYGKHRYQVEQFIKKKFPTATIVRLPGLFGPGLKKNVIFDLIQNNNISQINPKSSFQYYDLRNIWSDIQVAIDHNIQLLNIACEPIQTSDIADAFFPGTSLTVPSGNGASYDMKSIHARHWGKPGRYQYTREEVMRQLGSFVRENSTRP
jgi:nucleoside-diphosphate-sugar epimerase